MKTLTTLFLALLLSSQPLLAGSLDEFEEDVTTPRPQQKSKKNESSPPYSTYEDDENNCGSLGNCILGGLFEGALEGLIEIAGLIIVEGGQRSVERIYDTPPSHFVTPRLQGEPLIPYARLDSHFQNASDDIEGSDLKLELGYGPGGIGLRHTKFQESSPTDELKLSYIHGLYRMSLGNRVGLNLGFGQAILKGNRENRGGSLTFPLLIHWSENMGLEASYTSSNINGNRLTDREIALLATYESFSLSAGYRSVSGPNSSIQGPFAGISMRW